jgi:fructose/tagatose bisphosphate aldolase
MNSPIQEVLNVLDDSLVISQGSVHVTNPAKFKQVVHKLAEISALETGQKQGIARFLTRAAALDLDIYLASINDLYMARGRGEVPPIFSVPAMNLRVLSFEAAKAVFRAAREINGGAFIFEIARSEMTYSDQKPAEFCTSILAAAIAEGYKGPVFIQGDHFQVSSKRYFADSKAEIEALQGLIREAVTAGFYNIDVDTSTMVDLSKATIKEQQTLNTQLSALLTSYIRSVQPEGVTISIGGEIGEVGGHNSNEEELRAYLDGYREEIKKIKPGVTGLSKISIQTGTSHGGVVLPDGSIAQVAVDFETMHRLSRLASKEYGLGGAVQHGASTLPEDAFGKFVEAEACEVHLATNFMNMFYDMIPAGLRSDMYQFLKEKYAADQKPGMTDEQFYYKTRKFAVGPFKAQCWSLPAATLNEIGKAWEVQFLKLFKSFGMTNTEKYTRQCIKPTKIQPNLKDYIGDGSGDEDVSDLAD